LKIALRASGLKLLVFSFAVVTLAIFLGTLMHLFKGAEYGFKGCVLQLKFAISKVLN